MKRRSKFKIGRKEAYDTGDLSHLEVERSKVKVSPSRLTRRDGKSAMSSEQEGLRTSNLVYWWSTISRIADMRGDLHSESSGRLFKSVTTCRGGGILWRPHHRSRSLFSVELSSSYRFKLSSALTNRCTSHRRNAKLFPLPWYSRCWKTNPCILAVLWLIFIPQPRETSGKQP